MSKGSANSAMKEVGINEAFASKNRARSSDSYNELFPFLSGEVNNPTGFGKPTMDAMTTAGGQAVSGATGAANEQANLEAARTGNTAATSAIIGDNARNAMKQQSDNALGIFTNDAMLKEQQRQAGASGLGGLYDTGTDAALKSMGLANSSINAWTDAKTAAQNAKMGWVKTIGDFLKPKPPTPGGA